MKKLIIDFENGYNGWTENQVDVYCTIKKELEEKDLIECMSNEDDEDILIITGSEEKIMEIVKKYNVTVACVVNVEMDILFTIDSEYAYEEDEDGYYVYEESEMVNTICEAIEEAGYTNKWTNSTSGRKYQIRISVNETDKRKIVVPDFVESVEFIYE